MGLRLVVYLVMVHVVPLVDKLKKEIAPIITGFDFRGLGDKPVLDFHVASFPPGDELSEGSQKSLRANAHRHCHLKMSMTSNGGCIRTAAWPISMANSLCIPPP